MKEGRILLKTEGRREVLRKTGLGKEGCNKRQKAEGKNAMKDGGLVKDVRKDGKGRKRRY